MPFNNKFFNKKKKKLPCRPLPIAKDNDLSIQFKVLFYIFSCFTQIHITIEKKRQSQLSFHADFKKYRCKKWPINCKGWMFCKKCIRKKKAKKCAMCPPEINWHCNNRICFDCGLLHFLSHIPYIWIPILTANSDRSIFSHSGVWDSHTFKCMSALGFVVWLPSPECLCAMWQVEPLGLPNPGLAATCPFRGLHSWLHHARCWWQK